MKICRARHSYVYNNLTDTTATGRAILEGYSAQHDLASMSKFSRTSRERSLEERVEPILLSTEHDALYRHLAIYGLKAVVLRNQMVSETAQYFQTDSSEEIDTFVNQRWRLVFVARDIESGGTYMADWHGTDSSWNANGISVDTLMDCVSAWEPKAEVSKRHPAIVALSTQVSGALLHELVGHSVEADNNNLNELARTTALPRWLSITHNPRSPTSWIPTSRDDAGKLMSQTPLVEHGKFTGKFLGRVINDRPNCVQPSLRSSLSASTLAPRFYHLDVHAGEQPSIEPEGYIDTFSYFGIDKTSGQIAFEFPRIYVAPGMVANGARLFIRFSDFAQAIVGAIGPWRRRVNICIKNNVSVPVSYWSPKLLLDWKWLHARSRS